MSDIPADYQDRLNLREQIARIDRMREESQKYMAEQHKLNAEAEKFAAEQFKLMAEGHKLGRDRLLAPWLAIAGLVGGIITVIGALARLKGLTP
jgi:hypothetical protein